MAADRQQPLRHRQVAIGHRPGDHRLLRQLRLQLAPQRDAFEQRAGPVQPRQAERQSGVQVEMRVDEGRRHQPAAGVDLVICLRRQARLDRDDAAVLDADIDAGAAVGQVGVAQDEIHGGSDLPEFQLRKQGR